MVISKFGIRSSTKAISCFTVSDTPPFKLISWENSAIE